MDCDIINQTTDTPEIFYCSPPQWDKAIKPHIWKTRKEDTSPIAFLPISRPEAELVGVNTIEYGFQYKYNLPIFL